MIFLDSLIRVMFASLFVGIVWTIWQGGR